MTKEGHLYTVGGCNISTPMINLPLAQYLASLLYPSDIFVIVFQAPVSPLAQEKNWSRCELKASKKSEQPGKQGTGMFRSSFSNLCFWRCRLVVWFCKWSRLTGLHGQRALTEPRKLCKQWTAEIRRLGYYFCLKLHNLNPLQELIASLDWFVFPVIKATWSVAHLTYILVVRLTILCWNCCGHCSGPAADICPKNLC